MHEALDGLKVWLSPDVLEGIDTYDDAGVYRIDDSTALVQTLDFFTPIVDDPYDFGAIATANALSDVYAMGAVPVTAMNILCAPAGDLPMDDLHKILQGGADKLKEARCSLLGGHTVIDPELKFGCSVTGLIKPGEAWSNAGARPGQRLVLTKYLGTGILCSALKGGKLPEDSVKEVTRSLSMLNRAAAQAARKSGGIGACTDITGFGLAGHVGHMARVSKVTIRIETAKLPIFPEAIRLCREGLKTRGDKTNRVFLKDRWRTEPSVDPVIESLCFDPQTSGGLMLAVDPGKAKALLTALKGAGALAAHEVGEVLPPESGIDLILA